MYIYICLLCVSELTPPPLITTPCRMTPEGVFGHGQHPAPDILPLVPGELDPKAEVEEFLRKFSVSIVMISS